MKRHTRNQGGFALLMTVLLLLMLTTLGLMSMNVVQADQQVTGALNRKKLALHAADAGVSKALETLRITGTPSVPQTSVGDTSLYPQGQPVYREDPTVPQAITPLGGPQGLPGFNIANQQGNGPQFQVQYWKVNVEGQAPGGTVARVEFVTGSLATN